MPKTKGVGELIIDAASVKSGKYLSQDIDYLWSVLSGQTDPAVKYAVLELENTNLEKERKIQKLEKELAKETKRVNIIPEYVSGTYFFNERGPYCTTCYDNKEKQVRMIPKVFDYKRNMNLIIYSVALLSFLYIGMSFFKDSINETFLFIMQIILLIPIIFTIYYALNIINIKIKQTFKKRSDYTDLKCGVCKNTVKVRERSFKKYKRKVINNNKEKNIEELTPIYLTRIRELARNMDSRVSIADKRDLDIEAYKKIFIDIQKYNDALIKEVDEFSSERHKILNSKQQRLTQKSLK